MKRLLSALLVVSLFFASPYLTVTLRAAVIANLEAFWELEEASGARNDSFSTNHLTDNNTVTSTTGVVGTSAQFTKANSEYLSIADNAALSAGDTDFTIQFWIKGDTLASFPVAAGKGWTGGASATSEWVVYYATNINRWRFDMANGAVSGGTTANNAGAASTGTWYCVHVWHDSIADETGIAVNAGTPDTTSWPFGGLLDGAADFTLGGVPGSGFWDGSLDQVGFWRKVLTSGERTWLYNGGAGRTYSDIVNEGVSSCHGGLLLLGVGGC